jgi:RHS repeat-associated protein
VDGSGLCPPTTLYIGNYFECTSNGNTKYYYHGAQRLAIRRSGYPSGNGLFFLLGDHGVCASANTGSTAVQTTSGGTLSASLKYLHWGGERPPSGDLLTTFRFTGQRSEETSIGLYYYGARWYDSALGRFISADSLIPNPGNVLDWDRFAAMRNNPLRYTDPSGRCPVGDRACWALADELYSQYGWYMVGLGSNGRWTLEELQILWDAATAIEAWFASNGGGDARARMRAALGGTKFTKAGIVGNLILPGRHHVRGSRVHLLPDFSIDTIVHEIAYVLDNRLGTNSMASLVGGGPSDDMAKELGFDPRVNCPVNRSACSRYSDAKLKEEFPS